MSVLKYLPTFNQIEPENLYGLTMGYVVAQTPADATLVTKTVNGIKFIENGILCAIDSTGKKIIPATGKERQLFIHFTEELNTVIEGRKYFALEVPEDDVAYPRLVALVPGSVWTTNVQYDAAVLTAAGIVVIDDDAVLPDGTTTAVEDTDGTKKAKTYMYVGKVDA